MITTDVTLSALFAVLSLIMFCPRWVLLHPDDTLNHPPRYLQKQIGYAIGVTSHTCWWICGTWHGIMISSRWLQVRLGTPIHHPQRYLQNRSRCHIGVTPPHTLVVCGTLYTTSCFLPVGFCYTLYPLFTHSVFFSLSMYTLFTM